MLRANDSERQRTATLRAKSGHALSASGLPPPCLTLELTESPLLVSGDRVGRTLAALKEMGVMLTLDFGTGYASREYLQGFPFDLVKIDRSFVDQNDEHSGYLVLFKAIGALGSALRLDHGGRGHRDARAALDRPRARLPPRPGLLLRPPGARGGVSVEPLRAA
jgi:EAL domain-containing protein (putative c-di-GMP-specific phosphodiesterase class I)